MIILGSIALYTLYTNNNALIPLTMHRADRRSQDLEMNYEKQIFYIVKTSTSNYFSPSANWIAKYQIYETLAINDDDDQHESHVTLFLRECTNN